MLIINTGLIEISFLSVNEQYALTAYLQENETYSKIGEEMQLTDERARQLIVKGFEKILLTIRSLIAKSVRLESILIEKENIGKELFALHENFKEEQQLSKEGLIKLVPNGSNNLLGSIPFSVRAKRALDTLKIESIADLSSLTKEKLNSLRQVGVKTIDEIIRKSEEYGIKIE